MLKRIVFILFSSIINVSYATLFEVALIDDFNGTGAALPTIINPIPIITNPTSTTVAYAPAFGGTRTLSLQNGGLFNSANVSGGILRMDNTPDNNVAAEWSTTDTNGINVIFLPLCGGSHSHIHQFSVDGFGFGPNVNLSVGVRDIFGNTDLIQFNNRASSSGVEFDNILFSDMPNIDFSHIQSIYLLGSGLNTIEIDTFHILDNRMPIPSSFLLLSIGFIFLHRKK